MKLKNPAHSTPSYAQEAKAIKPVICYPPDTLPKPDLSVMRGIKEKSEKISEILIAPRDAECIEVPAGGFFKISCVEGAQVGDLNIWNAESLEEKFYSGKTRALHGTHLSTGDQLWSSFPYMRTLATIVEDSLDWYGFDEFGGSVHDVIGTRCDPYTGKLLSGNDYHYCCHSNLIRALAKYKNIHPDEAEKYVHDVLNVFMCTGFTRDTGQYFMKASPVRKGDFLEFYAHIDLLVGLSACPGGDCSSEHSSDEAKCYPLRIEVFAADEESRNTLQKPEKNTYDRAHGL